MMVTVPLADVQIYLGKEVSVSDWIKITQSQVNSFAEITGDHQFIHVDVQKAKRSPFGGTIAHGFYTLSLIGGMAETHLLVLEGVKMGLNYGAESVRFLSPVRVGSRVRARFTLSAHEERSAGAHLLTYEVVIDIEGEDKPALSARWLTLQYV